MAAVLFVCLGNICRSPTAEGVFLHLVEQAGLADRFVIDSAALANLIATAFETTIPINAYQVQLSQSGEMQWLGRRGGETVLYDVEPGTNFRQRAAVSLLSLLPIEWLL